MRRGIHRRARPRRHERRGRLLRRGRVARRARGTTSSASRCTSGTTPTTARCAGGAARPKISTTRAASPTTSGSRTTRSIVASSSRAKSSTPSSTPTSSGSTPSPCVACNRSVKMRELFALADRLGAAKVATGHYARIGHARRARRAPPRHAIRTRTRATFSTRSPRRSSSGSMFPLGEATKAEVRADAVAARAPRRHQGREPGALLRADRSLRRVRRGARRRVACVPVRFSTPTGRVVGHPRRGPPVHDWPAQRARRRARHARVRRRYRSDDVDGAARTRRRFAPRRRHASAVRASSTMSRFPLRATVQVRYRHEGVPATLHREPDGASRVAFDDRCAPCQGQVAVAYDG